MAAVNRCLHVLNAGSLSVTAILQQLGRESARVAALRDRSALAALTCSGGLGHVRPDCSVGVLAARRTWS